LGKTSQTLMAQILAFKSLEGSLAVQRSCTKCIGTEVGYYQLFSWYQIMGKRLVASASCVHTWGIGGHLYFDCAPIRMGGPSITPSVSRALNNVATFANFSIRDKFWMLWVRFNP